jgi:hypothetical protein
MTGDEGIPVPNDKDTTMLTCLFHLWHPNDLLAKRNVNH